MIKPNCLYVKRLIPLLLILFATVLMPVASVQCATTPISQSNNGSVIIANFDVPVDLGSSTFMQRVVDTAISQNATAIVIVMNTPGGLVSDMLTIINSIDQANSSGIAVYCYVPPNSLAASAGSYISMACNKILMGPGSEIGPSTPIVEGGTALEQNHTEGALLQVLVSQAERWNRNSTAAYYMVIADQAFSTDDAIANHVVDGGANSLDQALSILGLSGLPTQTLNESIYEQALSALSDSTIDGLLILLGIIAILIEFYHPTIILAIIGAIAIIAGLVGSESLGASALGFVILAIAAALVLAELKLGHGFAVMAGAVVGAFGIFYLSQGLVYSPGPNTDIIELELFIVVAVGFVGGLFIRWVLGPLRHRRNLTGPEAIIGKIGVAITDLKPDGEVRVNGIVWRATSVSGNINAGEKIKVKSMDELVLLVEKS
jgi:membrane-bound serine protease (ClpP class)